LTILLLTHIERIMTQTDSIYAIRPSSDFGAIAMAVCARVLVALLGIGVASAGMWGQVQAPALTGRVVDEAGLLSPSVAQALADRLEAHEQQWANQVVVLTLASLGGESIEEVSMRIAEAWKLGSAEEDNGVLVLVAPNDREMRIEVGQGLEGTLTDVLASRLIRNVYTPSFREGDFEGGILQGTEALLDVLEGDEERAAALMEDPMEDDLAGRLGAAVVIIPFVILFGFSGILSPIVPRIINFLFLSVWVGVFAFLFFPSQRAAIALLVVYAIVYWSISFSPWARRKRKKAKTNKWFGSSAAGWSGGSGSGGGWSSGGGFSGGGGSFGGGGASGRW
jgi:uncharacterized protein